jgi:RNA-directed DNA polymerase
MHETVPQHRPSTTNLRDEFLAVRTPEDLALLLGIDYEDLRDLLYRTSPYDLYKRKLILKRNGKDFREIYAPAEQLKKVQRRLNEILQSVYFPKRKVSAHGFLPERSILTNARLHANRRYVLNIDLKDFFPSIHYGRVRGMFMGRPYNLPFDVASLLARISCFQSQLPQGAPSSPVISNMICAKMDSQLQKLAKSQRCIYTRYADDLSFSTYTPTFPTALAIVGVDGVIELGSQLGAVLKENKFEVNMQKTRIHARPWRQQVTGLTVNDFPNVKRTYIRPRDVTCLGEIWL